MNSENNRTCRNIIAKFENGDTGGALLAIKSIIVDDNPDLFDDIDQVSDSDDRETLVSAAVFVLSLALSTEQSRSAAYWRALYLENHPLYENEDENLLDLAAGIGVQLAKTTRVGADFDIIADTEAPDTDNVPIAGYSPEALCTSTTADSSENSSVSTDTDESRSDIPEDSDKLVVVIGEHGTLFTAYEEHGTLYIRASAFGSSEEASLMEVPVSDIVPGMGQVSLMMHCPDLDSNPDLNTILPIATGSPDAFLDELTGTYAFVLKYMYDLSDEFPEMPSLRVVSYTANAKLDWERKVDTVLSTVNGLLGIQDIEQIRRACVEKTGEKIAVQTALGSTVEIDTAELTDQIEQSTSDQDSSDREFGNSFSGKLLCPGTNETEDHAERS